MLKRAVPVLAAVCAMLALPSAWAVWEWVNKPFGGKYQIYGGFLEQARAPSSGDIKLAINLTDNAAKEMFNAIGPDIDSKCAVQDIRLRQRDMLFCRYRPKNGYLCTLGFDLSTGLSIAGAISLVSCRETT